MPNGSIDYKLGEFTSDIKAIKSDIDEIKTTVNALNVWKWKIMGAATAVSLLGSIATKLIN